MKRVLPASILMVAGILLIILSQTLALSDLNKVVLWASLMPIVHALQLFYKLGIEIQSKYLLDRVPDLLEDLKGGVVSQFIAMSYLSGACGWRYYFTSFFPSDIRESARLWEVWLQQNLEYLRWNETLGQWVEYDVENGFTSSVEGMAETELGN